MIINSEDAAVLLRDMDFVGFKKRGNLSFYRLNPEFPLLEEIEAIVRKTVGIEFELGARLSKIGGGSFAFIFGSYAADGLRSRSDIDLYVIGRPDEDEVYRAVRTVEDFAGREINYHIAGVDEFSRKAEMESFVKTALAKPLMLVGTEDDLRKRARQART